jgi:CheY-like chemotaxis protein
MSSRKGPIVIIEDDIDDQEMFGEVFKELQVENELKFFENCNDGLNYLMETSDKPLLILSDINLPAMSGIEMRSRIIENDYLRQKSIPFVFLSTASKKEYIVQAYAMMVQGYFEKPDSLDKLKDTLGMIVNYWKYCKHPNMLES